MEIEARWQASSASSRSYDKSPWRVAHDIDTGWLVASLGAGVDGNDYYVVAHGVHASELRGGAEEDAEFIAHAPFDVRALVREVLRLRTELEKFDPKDQR